MSRMRVGDKDIRDAEIFEILLDNFPDIIHSVDDKGNIVFTNKKAESLLGYTEDELLSMNVREIYADEILEALDEGFDDLKKKGDVSVPESILKSRDGTRIPVEIRSFSIYDDAGNFLRTFSILRDIRPIKELQNSLVHSGRLAAVGEMASGIAHDIKNPLTVILLADQMIGREFKRVNLEELDERLQKVPSFVEDILRASKSIQKLVDHLRNFSRGIVEQYEVVDVYSVISDALFITANKLNEVSVEVENTIERGKHFIKGSPNQLEQVFVNLVANACDAMADRDERKVRIGIGPLSREGIESWECTVSDTGGGIPKEVTNHIFESFFTTKVKGKGTGLGLSISQGIVREHNGELKVESEPGIGTTFSVILPKQEQE